MTFASAELFLAAGAVRNAECLVLDIRMPGFDGLELQRRQNNVKSPVPIIFVTAHDDRAQREKAFEAGAVNFFDTPFDANVSWQPSRRLCFGAKTTSTYLAEA